MIAWIWPRPWTTTMLSTLQNLQSVEVTIIHPFEKSCPYPQSHLWPLVRNHHHLFPPRLLQLPLQHLNSRIPQPLQPFEKTASPSLGHSYDLCTNLRHRPPPLIPPQLITKIRPLALSSGYTLLHHRSSMRRLSLGFHQLKMLKLGPCQGRL